MLRPFLLAYYICFSGSSGRPMTMVPAESFVAVTVVMALLLFPALASAKDLIKFAFSSFNQSEYDKVFQMIGDSSISTAALQITPDTFNDVYGRSNKSGRVMLPQPFKLWEVSSSSSQNNSSGNSSTDPDIVASFNSTFLINIFRQPNQSAGEGFAFVIAPDLSIPSASYGQWLGLTNSTLDEIASNKIVAIELDTVKQEFDPDDNHIGLDIYSVKSRSTVSLSKFGIEISPEVSTNYTVWVEYNGKAKLMEVYMGDANSEKPNSPVLSEKINLKDYVKQYSYMGFSASTGVQAQLNCVLKWDLSIEGFPKKRNLRWVKIVIGVGLVGLALLATVVYGLVRYLKNRRIWNEQSIQGALRSLPGTPKKFRYSDLKKATSNFDERMMLGRGGFGVVYKGVLPREKTEIAVKKFLRDKLNGITDFLAELTIINRLRHKHLVPLLGWCHEKGLLLLVYEYMPKGSLDSHLYGGTEETLNWDRRSMIIGGVASALHYLHDLYHERVVHRDLKASNIMLDSNFNARLGDFGLARALDKEKTYFETQREGLLGTRGYMAPEYVQTGKATIESDVFGFGAVVLEVVCGQRPSTNIDGFQSLLHWVWNLHGEGRILDAVDKRIQNEYDSGQAERFLLLGLACSHPNADQRPKASIIVQIMSGSVPPLDVPRIRPHIVCPVMGFNIESLITVAQEQERGRDREPEPEPEPTPISAITSSCYSSATSELTPTCESRESCVKYSGISVA